MEEEDSERGGSAARHVRRSEQKRLSVSHLNPPTGSRPYHYPTRPFVALSLLYQGGVRKILASGLKNSRSDKPSNFSTVAWTVRGRCLRMQGYHQRVDAAEYPAQLWLVCLTLTLTFLRYKPVIPSSHEQSRRTAERMGRGSATDKQGLNADYPAIWLI